MVKVVPVEPNTKVLIKAKQSVFYVHIDQVERIINGTNSGFG